MQLIDFATVGAKATLWHGGTLPSINQEPEGKSIAGFIATIHTDEDSYTPIQQRNRLLEPKSRFPCRMSRLFVLSSKWKQSEEA